MSYTPTVWTVSTVPTGKRLNHLETQYAGYLAEGVATHAHDDDFYTKAEADAIFFYSGHMGSGSGFDADTLDSSHISALLSDTLPIGTVLIWSGYDSNVPANWALCTGQTSNGHVTPNLQDRFVIGAGGAYANGATGGAATFTPTASLTLTEHALTANEMPSHQHSYVDEYNPDGAYSGSGTHDTNHVPTSTNRTTSIVGNNGTLGNGQPHNHTGNTVAFDPVNALPVYYALYFIMKVKQ